MYIQCTRLYIGCTPTNLKQHLQPKLKLPVIVPRRRDISEARRVVEVQRRARIRERRRVEEVEELGPELHPHPLFHAERFEERRVDVGQTRTRHQIAPFVAVRVLRGQRIGRSRDAVHDMPVAAIIRRLSDQVRALTARARIRLIA